MLILRFHFNKQTTWLLFKPKEKQTEEEKNWLQKNLIYETDLTRMRVLISEFRMILEKKQAESLEGSIHKVEIQFPI